MTEIHECGGCAPPVITEDPYAKLKQAHAEGFTIMARADDGRYHVLDHPQWKCPADRYIAVGSEWINCPEGIVVRMDP